MKIAITILIAVFYIGSISGQQKINTWNPLTSSPFAIEGRGWHETPANYYRLPAKAKQLVTPDIWNLSTNSAGLLIRFTTNTPSFQVKYTVTGSHAFPHMPATGVSGLDLYGKDRDGKWFWFPGKYSFADTISYSFNNLLSSGDSSTRVYEYQLYLPLYNTVTWLEFAFPENKLLTPSGLRREKPIVVYGTSIAQGGCASRPGLAWTSVLERAMDRPLINLGFSGNGRLDAEVIKLMLEIDAKVYVLDCLPNLTDESKYPDAVVKKKITDAVALLHREKPGVPVVLSEHSAGSTTSGINHSSNNRYQQINNVLRDAYKDLRNTGDTNVFVLTANNIGFESNATVDGVHPADIGMQMNAAAYEKLLREILHEPSGTAVTTIPVSQSRDAFYFMPERHQEILRLKDSIHPETIFIGNSIVHMWGGEPTSSIVNGALSWNEYFRPLNTLNLGFGWDRIENVLWRIYHDELNGIRPKRIIVMIGTNNIGLNSDKEITDGLKHLYAAIRKRQPQSKLIVFGILPRRNEEKRVSALNKQIASIVKSFSAQFADPGKQLVDKNGITNESLFVDGLHPNEAGYQKLVGEIKKVIN